MNPNDYKAIEVLIELKGIKSMADGSYDVTFNFSEQVNSQIQWLIPQLKQMFKAVFEKSNRYSE